MRATLRSPHFLVVATLLIAGAVGCRALTESDDARFCRSLNAFGGDTVQMRVGDARLVEANGFTTSGRQGTCVGTVRDIFVYTSDAPTIVSVHRTTGMLTAHAAGATVVRARGEIDGRAYRGALDVTVLPAE